MKVTMVEKVKDVISKHPITADSDLDLMYVIWQREYNKINEFMALKNLDVLSFLKLLKSKKLSGFQNITRSRRKCQEMYPETRGKVYTERHNKQQETLDSLGYRRK